MSLTRGTVGPVLLKVLDLGSNSFQLRRFRVEASRVESVDLAARSFGFETRLSPSGDIAEPALDDALRCVQQLLAAVPAPGELVGVARGALRTAGNVRSLLHAIESTYRCPVFLLTSAEEAELAYRGAWTKLAELACVPTAVVDIGSSTTHIAIGDAEGSFERLSLPVGTTPLSRLIARRQLWPAVRRILTGGAVVELQTFPPKLLAFTTGVARAVLQVGRRLSVFPPGAGRFAPSSLRIAADCFLAMDDLALLEAGCPESCVDALRPGACLMSGLVDATMADSFAIVSAGLAEGVAEVIAQVQAESHASAPAALGLSLANSLLSPEGSRLRPALTSQGEFSPRESQKIPTGALSDADLRATQRAVPAVNKNQRTA